MSRFRSWIALSVVAIPAFAAGASAQVDSIHDTPRPKETLAEVVRTGRFLCIDGPDEYVGVEHRTKLASHAWQLPCGTWVVSEVDPETSWLWLGKDEGLCEEFLLLDCSGNVIVASPRPGQRFVVPGYCCEARTPKARVWIVSKIGWAWRDKGSGYSFAEIDKLSNDSTPLGSLWTCTPEANRPFKLFLGPGGVAWRIPVTAEYDSDAGIDLHWKEEGGSVRVVKLGYRVDVGKRRGSELVFEHFEPTPEVVDYLGEHWPRSALGFPEGGWQAGPRSGYESTYVCTFAGYTPTERDYYFALNEFDERLRTFKAGSGSDRGAEGERNSGNYRPVASPADSGSAARAPLLQRAATPNPPGSPDGEEILEPGPNVVPPILLSISKPKYPTAAVEGRIEGDVSVMILVDEEGRVADVELVSGVGMGVGIDEAALEAARSCVFRPAMKNGRVRKMRYHLVIPFRL